MNKLLCTIALLYVFGITSVASANPWKASPVFTETFDYVVVDEKGARYPLKIQYDGILNFYEYQTGNARFPDNRECHYGFKRQLRRSLPAQEVVFDTALMTKVSREHLYMPNLGVAEASDSLYFLYGATNGALNSPSALGVVDKLVVQNLAKVVMLKSGNNCGEMRGAIDGERNLGWTATSAAKVIAEVDQFMIAIELSGSTRVFNPEGQEYRDILFVYPSSIKNGYEGLAQPLIERAYTLSTLSSPPKEVITAWLKRVREPDWQANMWREFSVAGVQSISKSINADKDSATSLMEQSGQAFQYNKKVCVSEASTSLIPLGGFLVDPKQILQQCGVGCASIPSSPAQQKSDIDAFKEMLVAKMYYINAELDRLAQIEQHAVIDNETADIANATRSSAQALSERIENWQSPVEQTMSTNVTPTHAEMVYLGCLGQVLAAKQRQCGNGPC